MREIACLNCGRPYPESGAPYRCLVCGGLYDYRERFAWREPDPSRPGIWHYLQAFGADDTIVSLCEGATPLVACDVSERRVYFKCEYANPTGSFKDRGSAVICSFLLSRGIDEAIEDSSGNAGASFAAYAARAGIKARVYVPDSASGPKRKQIEFYGAELTTVPGPRTAASEAARKAADSGIAYASHAYLPYNLEGYGTCAYELVDQLGRAPGTVILPAGQGGLLLGLGRGFQAMLEAGLIKDMPALVGVQAAACAPLAALFEIGLTGLNFVTEAATVAEGVRVRSPVRADAVLKMVRASGGSITAVDEPFILPARDALARLGFYVEPTSALVWHVLSSTLPNLADPVIVILTGSGYKVRL